MLLGGCGFEPVHGQRSQASAAALEQFDIAIVEDRVGQMLRNELLTMMHPRGERRAPVRFSLRIVLTEARQDLAIRRDETATRANLTLSAAFAVHSPDETLPIYAGSAVSVISHNILTSDYATIAARADARERGVRQIAHSITERLSVWLLQTGGRPIRPAESGPADDGAATGVPASPASPARPGRPGGPDDPDAAGIR
ncbi:MAG: hypothetical protein WD470_02165 [Rhodospirillaceae bacterium]